MQHLSGEAAAQQCTGFLTFNFSQIPPTPWGMQTPSWEQGAAPGEQRTRPARAQPRRRGSLSGHDPAKNLLGRECSGWVFFKLKFSFQGLWKSLPGLHNPAAKSNLKRLEPRSEIGKYLTWGSGSLLHRPSQTSNHHRMRTGNGMSSFACIKLTFCWFKV